MSGKHADRSAWWLASACVLCACVELPDLADPSLVTRPRLLAIVAEPPEVQPGQSSTLSVLVGGARDQSVSWRACAAFDSFVNSAQYGAEADDEGCSGRSSLPLGEGPSVVFDGALTATLFDDLEAAAVIFGGTLPPATLEQIRSRVGLPFVVEATVRADGETLRGVKRVLLSESPEPHANPPAPYFRANKVEIVADPNAHFVCTPRGGSELIVAAARELELVPIVDGEKESWLEDFAVIDARGTLIERKERAFYSWFASAGRFASDVTKSPLRDNRWLAPGEPGRHTLWLALRDGHGGASACALQVVVE